MKLSEIINTVRREYLDDTELSQLWSDTYLARCASQAEMEAARRAKLLFDKTTVTDDNIASGTATTTTTNKLIDTAAVFVSANVVGKTVYNLTDNTFATVSAFVSATELTLSSDIMVIGESYVIGDPTKALTRLNIVSGTATYPLSRKIVKIENPYLLSVGIPLVQKTEGWLDSNYYQWRTAEGTPQYYVEDKGTITLVPKPDATLNSNTGKDTLLFSVYRLPLKDLSLSLNNSPEIPEEYHLQLIDWICHLAYLKDSEGGNSGKADYYAGRFAMNFGNPVSALVENNMRKLSANFRLDGPSFM